MGATGSKTPRATTKQGREAGAMFDDVELHVISLTYKDLAGLSKGDKRGEAIDKATFLQNFPVPGLVGDRLFHALDSNKTGRISFDDFVVGLAVCCRGTLEEKMRFIFEVYDMDGDGFISRDELLLMLNQVPRTLLSIGGDGSANEDDPSQIDWNSLMLAQDGKHGDVRHPPPSMITPHSSRASGGDARFFRNDHGGAQNVPPPLQPAPAPIGSVGRSRGSSGELSRRNSGVSSHGGASSVAGRAAAAAAFTNETIADQALTDFGSGDGAPLTFLQFQRWAQQTPAVQALLQGAFPSDAHFSLATSPRARRVSCESLSSFDSPRRVSSARIFGTPTRSSVAASTAVAAVAGWSASAAAAPPPPASRRGTPSRQRSFGGDRDADANGRFFFSADAASMARTPARNLSRNTSYDNLLRTPLVGPGVGGQGSSGSPIARGLGAGKLWSGEEGGRAELPGEAKSGTGHVWRWGPGGDGVPKTPKTPSRGSWNEDDHGAGGAAASGMRGGIRMDRDVSVSAPLTTGRTRRKNLPSGPSPLSRGSSSPALTLEPSPSSSRLRSFQRRTASDSSSFNNSEDIASRSSSRRPSFALSSSGGGGVGVGNGETGGPPKTPLKLRGERYLLSPPGTTEMTRKAKKLAMMAAAAETAEAMTGGRPTSCQDLLALVNAAAVADKPPAPAPRRGKLMRYLSHDGLSDSRGSSTPGRSRLMRMVSHDAGGGDGGAERGIAKRISLRRSNSLSAAEYARRISGTGSTPGRNGRAGRISVVPTTESRQESKRGESASSIDMNPNYDAASASRTGNPHDVTSPPRARGGAEGEPPLFDNSMRSSYPRDYAGSVDDNCSLFGSDFMGGPNANASLGSPLSKFSSNWATSSAMDGLPVVEGQEGVARATVGAEAVVRDCLYNSHGMVALDGYLWKPGSIRLVRRWMMLVDNTLYYFVRPGDRKPRGVISMPGCIAEAVADEDSSVDLMEPAPKREPRKSRVPPGYFGLRLFRPNNHGRDTVSRLLLAKTAQERNEWVAELRVASRVVPLEESFELKALLRKGAFASVHRCLRKETGEEYAVKIIDKTSLSSHEKFLLRGEIGALKLVSHPNVVRLEAVHEDPRSIAIVMTLCRGGDLWDKVRSQPSRCFNATQARTVMRPLCEAVSYLHTLGILHRDIKPENILLVDNGTGNLAGVTLSDFGFSHQVSPKSRLACGKQLMGTPSYMAPESILHGMYGKEVDWFSCGCVLYMMLMGRAPFAGSTPSEIFRNTCHGRLGLGRGGASLWDKLPPAARELIVGLMQLDHNLRFTGEQAMSHRWLEEPDETALANGEVEAGRRQQRRLQENGEAASRERSARRKEGDRRSRSGTAGSSSRRGSRNGGISGGGVGVAVDKSRGGGGRGGVKANGMPPPVGGSASTSSVSSSSSAVVRGASETPSDRVREAT